jgi:hypothetical protein
MKHLILLFLFLTSPLIEAQSFENLWTGHFSYVSIKAISQGNDRIYAASENAVFTYDLSTEEIETISTVNGLAGELISTIYYSEIHNLLVIGYENGLMEVVIDGEENILTVVDILDKPTIPPDRKKINHFNEYNDNLYIATEYGISVFDLAALEFGDTYFIGNMGAQFNVTQTTVQEPYIFAATTQGGIRRAMVNDDNLIDFESWLPTILSGIFYGIQTLGDEIYIVNNSNNVFRMTPEGDISFVEGFGDKVENFQSYNDILTITSRTTIKAFSEGYVEEASVSSLPDFEYQLQSGLAFNNTLYLGTTESGMLTVPFGTNQVEQILPDGPLLNKSFAIDASAGQLWTVFGEYSVTFDPFFPNGLLSFRGISNLRDGAWTNISYNELSEALGGKEINDLVHVKINQDNANEVYISSYQKGLLKIDGQDPVQLYDQNNSSLEIPPVTPPDISEEMGIRLLGSDFDRQGNLWFVQSRSNEGLVKLSPSGQFEKIDVSDIVNGESEQAFTQVAVSSQ